LKARSLAVVEMLFRPSIGPSQSRNVSSSFCME